MLLKTVAAASLASWDGMAKVTAARVGLHVVLHPHCDYNDSLHIGVNVTITHVSD